MNKVLKHILQTLLLLMISFGATSCSDNDSNLGVGGEYGYFQMKLSKQLQTRAITGGSTLEYLNDAKKIQVDLLYNNRQITQTLNLTAVSTEAAEMGLTTESVRLLEGEYILTAYRIYGEYIEGTTVGDQAPILQEGEPDDFTLFEIKSSRITTVQLPIEVQRRGNVSFILDKDFSNILPETKATGFDPERFRYENIAFVEMDIRTGLTGTPRAYRLATHSKQYDYLKHTDTLSIREGNYTIVQMRMLDKMENLLVVVDQQYTFSVEDSRLTRKELPIEMPLTEAFKDYIALYNIWKALDGENWHWRGIPYNDGSNWLFRYTDGTPRPLDAWGNQPGVTLDANGRVAVLNVGGFNPKGFVPDDIGQLTKMQQLYLGGTSDVSEVFPDEGPLSVDRYNLMLQGVNIFTNRLEIAKEELRLRHTRAKDVSTLAGAPQKKFVFAKSDRSGMTSSFRPLTNRITGLSDQVGLCKELTYLSIANGMVSQLPVTIADITELTDLVFFNSPVTEFPEALFNMPQLISLIFSEHGDLESPAMQQALTRFFDSPTLERLQLLYLTGNHLTQLPSNISNLKNIGLLDVSNNKLTEMPQLGLDVAPIQIFMNRNRLRRLPADFCNVDDIESFVISENLLEEFPNIFDATSIFKQDALDFSDNKLTHFPADFKGLVAEILNLNDNLFTTFPIELSATKSHVDFIQISHNRIDSFPPEALTNLTGLKALDCKRNDLQYLPHTFNAEVLPYLSGLEISNNQFAIFPIHVLNVSSLADLRIADQYSRTTERKTLRAWPEGIEKHYALRSFDISNNDIHRVIQFPSSLNFLNVSGNPNISMGVPADVVWRINNGYFRLVWDADQDVYPN